MFEEQKNVIEQRYRTLLEDAVQDAVFLSTRNNELMQENQALKQGIQWVFRNLDSLETFETGMLSAYCFFSEIAELKDSLSLSGRPPAQSVDKA